MARDLSDVVRDARAREEQEAPPARVMRVTTLADLRSGSVPATMIVRGMPINIEYDPDGLTLETLMLATSLDVSDESDNATKQMALRLIADMLVMNIRKWDLGEADSDDVVPLTHERLAKFGIGLLNDMAQALVKATRMGEANGTPSRPRSSRTASSATRGSSRR